MTPLLDFLIAAGFGLFRGWQEYAAKRDELREPAPSQWRETQAEAARLRALKDPPK